MTHRSIPRTDEPLRGVRVLVTRPREHAEDLRSGLERLGAEVSYLPTISIRLSTDTPEAIAALNRLDDFDWVTFTSRNAVRGVLDWLSARDLLMPATVKVGAVGAATAQELTKRNITPDCIPLESSARALAAELISTGVNGCAVLLPLGNLAGDELRRSLEQAGARVTAIRVYETVPAQTVDTGVQRALARGEIDVVALASPSAFRNLLDLCDGTMREALRGTLLVAIGPTTAEAIRSAGFKANAVAATQTMEGMVDAIVDVYRVEQA